MDLQPAIRPIRPELLPPTALQTFVAVTDHGSFSAAAAPSGYTQSAVSRQIAALEQLCGVELFVRGPRGVRVTTAGALLLPHARSVLGHLTAAARTLEAAQRSEVDCLRIGATSAANATLLPLALSRFRADHPDVPISLCEATPAALLRMLESSDVDLAVLDSTGALPSWLASTAVSWLLDDPLMVALPQDHRLAGLPRTALADLAVDDWIVEEGPDALDRLQLLCGEAGFVPHAPLRVSQRTSGLRLVSAGLGVMLVSGLCLQQAPEGLVLVPFDPAPPRRHILAVLSDHAGSAPPAVALLAHLRAAATDIGATAPAPGPASGVGPQPGEGTDPVRDSLLDREPLHRRSPEEAVHSLG